MKTALLLFLFIVISCLSCLAETNTLQPGIPQGIYTYQEKVGEKTLPFTWQAEKTQDVVAISVFEESKSFLNLCSSDGKTFKWQLKAAGKHDITAERQGNTLLIGGIFDGKEHHERVEIDERPWYQPLSFSLGPFLDSEEQSISFWTIRVDNLEVVALKAEKIGEEMLQQGETAVAVQIVEVRAEGFYSSFWHASYRFRKSDNLFLEYKSVHGLPGTDETVVTLIKSPTASDNS